MGRVDDRMGDDITCEDQHLAGVDGIVDIIYDDLNPECVRLWYWD